MMNECMNEYAYLFSANQTKSLEALVAEEMTFESFCECLSRQSLTGRLFHVAGPDTAKSHQWIVVHVRGTTATAAATC